MEHLPRVLGSAKKSSLSILITISTALGGGLCAKSLGLPAPFLMGSLVSIWVIGLTIKAVRPSFAIPTWFFIPIMLGLGTLIGSNFNPEIIQKFSSYVDTTIAMCVATFFASVVGVLFLTRFRAYDLTTSLLCCIPGGQAEAIILSQGRVEKEYVVALFHLVRVTLVFVGTPLFLGYFQGSVAIEKSNQILTSMPNIMEIDLVNLGSFILVAVCSYPVAKVFRLPMPHFIGPIAVSSALHIAGLVEIPRISEFLILTQLVIGARIGERLCTVQLRELLKYTIDAIMSSMIILGIYISFAFVLNHFSGGDLFDLLLAFVPGGLYEVTLLAIIFGFDVAFVVFHHIIRVITVVLALPIVLSFIKK